MKSYVLMAVTHAWRLTVVRSHQMPCNDDWMGSSYVPPCAF